MEDDWCKTVLERFSNPAVRDTIYRWNEDATHRMASYSDDSEVKTKIKNQKNEC
jgi:mannitol-1-phosphate/altronate dehydrogenase